MCKHEGVQRRTDQPLIVGARTRRSLTGHGVAVERGNVRRNFGTGQTKTRKVSVGSCPFTRDQYGDLGGSGRDAGQIQLTNNLGKLLELGGQWFVLTVPGRHSPARLLWSSKVWRFVELLGVKRRYSTRDLRQSTPQPGLSRSASGHRGPLSRVNIVR